MHGTVSLKFMVFVFEGTEIDFLISMHVHILPCMLYFILLNFKTIQIEVEFNISLPLSVFSPPPPPPLLFTASSFIFDAIITVGQIKYLAYKLRTVAKLQAFF